MYRAGRRRFGRSIESDDEDDRQRHQCSRSETRFLHVGFSLIGYQANGIEFVIEYTEFHGKMKLSTTISIDKSSRRCCFFASIKRTNCAGM